MAGNNKDKVEGSGAEGQVDTVMDKKIVTEVITTSKITNWVLMGKENYLQWKRTIERYIMSVDKTDHLTKDPPSEKDAEARKLWLQEDYRLYNQIEKTLTKSVWISINHLDTVKELMQYIEFMYGSKQDLNHIHNLMQSVYRAAQKGRTLF